jgi:hypothetical protein
VIRSSPRIHHSVFFITLRLPASGIDFGRRLVRSPKIHFFDSACMENRAVWEIYCNARQAGIVPGLSYWRDSNGFEIQLIVQTEAAPIMPVCIAGQPNPSDVARLHRWMDLAGVRQGAIIAQAVGQLQRKEILSYSIAQL